jgi:hypothetical protein
MLGPEGPEGPTYNGDGDDSAWSAEEDKLLALQLQVEQRRAHHQSLTGHQSLSGSLRGSKVGSQAGSRPASPGRDPAAALRQAGASAPLFGDPDSRDVDVPSGSAEAFLWSPGSGFGGLGGGLNDELAFEPRAPLGFQGLDALLSPPPPARSFESSLQRGLPKGVPTEASATAGSRLPPVRSAE